MTFVLILLLAYGLIILWGIWLNRSRKSSKRPKNYQKPPPPNTESYREPSYPSQDFYEASRTIQPSTMNL